MKRPLVIRAAILAKRRETAPIGNMDFMDFGR